MTHTMDINKVRVKVNSASQMKIAMTLLQEISGLKVASNRTRQEHIEKFPCGDDGKTVGIGSDKITSWSSWSGNISFSDFVIEAAKMLEEEQIKLGEHTVEFKSNGVQVGCTFVSKEIVKKIYKKLFNN